MSKISAEHLARCACVYVRQSSPDQVQNNLESQRSQYALADRARELGWQSVEVIDDDLGISGSGTRRPGFERLLRAVCDGQVGAIFTIDASRLARNLREWHTLVEFCGVMNALLVDAEGIYDPKQINDRLLLGMKGTISEMEVASFRERAQLAMTQKAQRGELFKRVPIGFVKAPDDRVEKNSDSRVREAIELIFRKFAELGSAQQVYLSLSAHQIQLPVARGREAEQEIVWQPARYHAVLSVLKNPMYAGAYTYGRTRRTVRIEEGRKKVARQLRRKQTDWAVLIQDHHEGYITWDVYQSNQALIAHNENAKGTMVRGSVRRGEALLAGLLRCGHCGARLLAQYPDHTAIRYQCSAYRTNRDKACCVMFGGLRADQMVSEQVLQCLTPLSVAAAIEAIENLEGKTDERIRHKQLALEHARYEVTRARRQYDAVDPTNRLVAAELERRWNEALRVQAEVEADLTALQKEIRPPLSDSTKRELLAVGNDVALLWNHPMSTAEHKKRILRVALREIIVTSEGDAVRLVLHWQGGDHTQLELKKQRSGQHRYVTEKSVVETVRQLARIETDARIASILNKAGLRSAHGQTWTARIVCSLRSRQSISPYKEGEKQLRGEMSVSEAAAVFGLTQTAVLRLIRLKKLPATQVCKHAPWILRKEDVQRVAAERAERSTQKTVYPNQLILEIQ